MKSIREQFAETSYKIALKDKNYVVIVGDISHGIFQKFNKKFNKRYYNIGICEPGTINVAAGLSKIGLTPVVHTIAPFLIERSYEQIKLDFGYQNLPINLVSVGGAFDYSKLGCSHHCYTDFSLISHFKNSNIVCAGSPLEFDILFNKVYKKNSINYFKVIDNTHGYRFKKNQIKFGKGIKISKGDITVICFGFMLNRAIKVKKILEKQNIKLEILYFHTLKPLDEKLIIMSLKKTKKCLVLDELSASDGLTNKISKIIIDNLNLKKTNLSNISIENFIHHYGGYNQILDKIGFSIENIVKKIKKLNKNAI